MKAVILALALSCAGAFAPVNKAAVRAPVELEAKKSVADLSEADLKGKKVLIRCDLNVPIKEGVIGDDTRIRASVPTVKYLLDKGAKVAMCSHLGRPKDGPEDKFSLGPVATRMGEQLGTAVKMAPDCIGDEAGAGAELASCPRWTDTRLRVFHCPSWNSMHAWERITRIHSSFEFTWVLRSVLNR